MRQDNIQIDILEDGTIKVTTDAVSPANHLSADKFLAEMQRMAGGEHKQTRRPKGRMHHHHHSHNHTHA